MIRESVWDDPQNVDTLRRMHAGGASYSEIALAIGNGVTRNSAIGKAKRLKLVRIEAAAASGKKGRSGMIGFASRRIGKDCSWIIGEPTDAKCCGQPVKDGTEWCEHHYHRAFARPLQQGGHA